jgi:hypothetical protein
VALLEEGRVIPFRAGPHALVTIALYPTP